MLTGKFTVGRCFPKGEDSLEALLWWRCCVCSVGSSWLGKHLPVLLPCLEPPHEAHSVLNDFSECLGSTLLHLTDSHWILEIKFLSGAELE